MTRSYTFLYPEMIVHRTGCSDIKRDHATDTKVVVIASTISEACAKELIGDLEEMGYTPADFIVKPCAKAN